MLLNYTYPVPVYAQLMFKCNTQQQERATSLTNTFCGYISSHWP